MKRPVPPKRICEYCGEEYQPTLMSGQKYCSKRCGGRASEARKLGIMTPYQIKTQPRKTDWKAIGRLMAETGKQYAQLRREGLI